MATAALVGCVRGFVTAGLLGAGSDGAGLLVGAAMIFRTAAAALAAAEAVADAEALTDGDTMSVGLAPGVDGLSAGVDAPAEGDSEAVPLALPDGEAVSVTVPLGDAVMQPVGAAVGVALGSVDGVALGQIGSAVSVGNGRPVEEPSLGSGRASVGVLVGVAVGTLVGVGLDGTGGLDVALGRCG